MLRAKSEKLRWSDEGSGWQAVPTIGATGIYNEAE